MRLRIELEVCRLPDKGRSVVARGQARPGDVLEVAQIVPLAAEDRAALCGMALGAYPFVRREGFVPFNSHPGAMALGDMAFCNHSLNRSNARVDLDFEAETATLTATAAINPGDEVTIPYTDHMEYADADQWADPVKGPATAHPGP